MIKTSIVRRISIDDVRGIPHLTAVGMMATDIFTSDETFDHFGYEDFTNMLGNYVMRCDPETKSKEYFTKGAPHKRVVFSPAGFDGIKVEYSFGYNKKVVYWSIDDYMELSGEWENAPEDDDEEWFK